MNKIKRALSDVAKDAIIHLLIKGKTSEDIITLLSNKGFFEDEIKNFINKLNFYTRNGRDNHEEYHKRPRRSYKNPKKDSFAKRRRPRQPKQS